LRWMVRTAYRNVAYYRRVWDAAGIDPDAIRTCDDLPRLPVATKGSLRTAALRERLDRRVIPERTVQTSTSGYLGIPLTIHMSRSEAAWRRLTLIRAVTRYTGFRLPMRVADVGPMTPHAARSTDQQFGPLRLLRLPATIPPNEAARDLLAFRPSLVEGYPTCLDVVASELEQMGRRPAGVRLVISRGEVLHEATRRRLSATFDCRVVDLYNCEEAGNLAYECPRTPGLWHVNRDVCVLEVVDATGQPVDSGIEGRLLLTNLYNATMPFIRYELGDRAAWAERSGCGCRRWGPSIVLLSGRDDDFLRSPTGARLSPRLVGNTVFNVLRDPGDSRSIASGIGQFQILQGADGDLTLRVVYSGSGGPGRAAAAAAALEWLVPGRRCRVERVDEIPVSPSGKLKKVVAEPSA